MSFITLDFETYYSKDFSLSKMTTEEYIRSPEFEVIGVGVKIDDNVTEWVTEGIQAYLSSLDWENSAVLMHNALFDGAILEWIYGVKPQFYFDTLCMARAIHGVEVGGSLASLVQRYELGEKGTEVVEALGKRRADFSSADLDGYGAYCRNDVELTFALFAVLAKSFPQPECELINMTIKMFTRPQLMLDDALLVQRLEDIKREKSELLTALMGKMQCDTEEDVRKKLSSNKQFAEVLLAWGVEAPMKISKTTGKPALALAKTDEGFITLTEHEDPFIQQLCAVRLGTKSTIEESRVARFIDIGARNRGYLPVPLKYYGAHTGRWAGYDKVNFQNLPSRDKKKKALKNAVIAPLDHLIINCDSSQIEARVLAWWAGQDDVTAQFARGEDVYSIFASKIYKKTITKANPVERFVGKTCIGIGSLVLSERGWTPIEQIRLSDRVWDGEEWVCHSGVVLNGTKETLQIHGLSLTPDHEVWSGIWQRADSLQQDADTLSRALGIAAANLPLQATWSAPEGFVRLSSDVIADQMSTRSITTTSRTSNRLGVIYVRSRRLVRSVIGSTQKLCRTMLTGRACLTALLLRSHVATLYPAGCINTTGREGYMFAMRGETTAQSSSGTYKLYPAGITQISKWIELITTQVMSRGTYALSLVSRTLTTSEKCQTLKPVYDILNCGLRSRFTVLTNNGPLIVHNCILGLGYGTGAEKLRHTLKTSPPGADLPIEQCKEIVSVYRSANYRIPELWRECDLALKTMMSGDFEPFFLDSHKCVLVTPEGIKLPNGLYIRYANLRLNDEGKMIYDSRRGPVNIWGGAMVENIVQALARIIVGEQLTSIDKVYPLALTVHDAGLWVVHKDLIESAEKFIVGGMSTAPDWAAGLPVTCELKSAERYGDC